MKNLMLLLLMITFLYKNGFADEIEISAQEFIGDEKKKTTHLKGNVDIKRKDDRLLSNQAYIYFDNKNKPDKMQALGNVKFWLTLENNRKIEGISDEVIYLPNIQEYQLLGNVVVKEPAQNNEVKGDKIIIRYKDGYINVVGNSNKPARLIFKFEKEQ
ncbi:LptA/OstA family protein [Helicobacter mesocricetorum]|uniref:LptA/OstA family protein n=1 Tax=Helicobacter mesocricetorum TaxID=87012 RepID=UPI000CF03523|nr:LptA/OstA family protein [Helicobacter mesocricetorum]